MDWCEPWSRDESSSTRLGSTSQSESISVRGDIAVVIRLGLAHGSLPYIAPVRLDLLYSNSRFRIQALLWLPVLSASSSEAATGKQEHPRGSKCLPQSEARPIFFVIFQAPFSLAGDHSQERGTNHV